MFLSKLKEILAFLSALLSFLFRFRERTVKNPDNKLLPPVTGIRPEGENKLGYSDDSFPDISGNMADN